MMTAGDEASRTGLEDIAQLSEDLARRYTLTSEPEYPPLRRLVDLVKGHPLAQMAFPFVRTPANIIEQGAQRIPFVGSLAHKFQKAPDSMRQRVVQQALGGGVMVGSGLLGANVDPNDKLTPKYLSNMMGVYSLPAALGYGIGQAFQKGDVTGPLSAAQAGVKSFNREMPLPALRTFEDLSKLFSEGEVPSFAYPRFLKEGYDYLQDNPNLLPDGTVNNAPF
jgi:hypothetical protein